MHTQLQAEREVPEGVLDFSAMPTHEARMIAAAGHGGLRVTDDDGELARIPAPCWSALLSLYDSTLILAPGLDDTDLRAEVIAFGVAVAVAAADCGPDGGPLVAAPAGWLAILPERQGGPETGPGRLAREMLNRGAELAGDPARFTGPVQFKMHIPAAEDLAFSAAGS